MEHVTVNQFEGLAVGGVPVDIVAPVGVVVVWEKIDQMADDKRKAERHFNWQALKEAVERMKPELGAASEATHKLARKTPRTTAISTVLSRLAT